VHGRTDDPWDVEAESPALDFGEVSERPSNIVNVEDLPRDPNDPDYIDYKGLADAAGSVQTGLNWLRIQPGHLGTPPHCHSEEEEVFVVLAGDGTLELWPSPRAAQNGAQREGHAVRAGSVVARPPATRIGHTLRAGPNGITYLVYGTRRPNDICYYPRSNKISWRGVGVIGRIEHLDYWDGEPRD
jgi:uncharacterized cupin superfamily protein